MTAWTDATPDRPEGVVLHPDRLDEVVTTRTVAPGPLLAELVERHWTIAWELAPGQHHRAALVPHLSPNITHEVGAQRAGARDTVVVTGVATRRFDVDLTGQGYVLGTKWRAGAFAALVGVEARALTDRTVPGGEVLPAAVVRAYASSTDPGDPVGFRHTVEEALAPLADRVDEGWRTAAEALRVADGDPDITTVSALAAAVGLSDRALQRLFARYVGVSPKQAIARARIHDAVAALDAGVEETLADLAVRLGFYDQAHLAREFTQLVGIAPSAYRAGRPVR